MSEGDDPPPPTSCHGRRKSVFCETYNPEEEEEDDDATKKVVFPKTDEQRKQLRETIKNIFLFRSLDCEQLQTVLDAMFEKHVTAGEVIIKQGDDGDNFYVIESGTYKATAKRDNKPTPKLITTYEGVGSFGELALLHDMPRAATIQAMSSGKLWAVDRQTFRHIVLKGAFIKRKMHEALINNVPMLRALRPYERTNVADALVARSFKDGDRLIQQGATADGMYFVEEGAVRLTLRQDDGEDKELSRIVKGGYFGELALVTKKPRAVSVFAVGNIKVAFLDVDAFERLLGPCMHIMKRNINDYEQQLVTVFGKKANISDLRS